MKLDTNNLIEQLLKVLHMLRQRAAIICFIVFGIIYAYIMITVSGLSQQVPDESAVNEKLTKVARPKVDEEVAQTMLGLEERNITIKSIFEDARRNPFTE